MLTGLRAWARVCTCRWVSMDDERKYNKDALEALLRARLISLPELDALAAKALLQGRSQVCLG